MMVTQWGLNREEYFCVDFPGAPVVKNLPANAGDMGSILGKRHGQRSLASGLHSPWGHKESDMT